VAEPAPGPVATPAPVPPSIGHGSFEGLDAVMLGAGGYEMTVVPELGLLGASILADGREILSLHGGVDAYRQGHTTGLPLLHPWANRLARPRYEIDGTWVEFPLEAPVHVARGLPIHGTMTAAKGWRVEAELADSTRATLQARYTFDQPEQLRSFPFPHEVVVFVEVSDLGVRVTTTLHAGGALQVPVSFGWHPYFVVPGAARRDVDVLLPELDHLEVDGEQIPTGNRRRVDPSVTPLGDAELERGVENTFDDGYRLVEGAGRVLAIEAPHADGEPGARHRVAIELDDFYPYAQVYAPSSQPFVALEPMTAPTNALLTHDHPSVPPGESYSASFRVWAEVVPPFDPDADPDADTDA